MGLLVVGVGCWLLVGVGWITVVPVLICCCFVVLVVLCGCLVVRYSFVLLVVRFGCLVYVDYDRRGLGVFTCGKLQLAT